MAVGDVLLDATGNVILNDDGNVELDNGADNDCCCTPDCTLTCFTLWSSRWDCDALVWGAWVNLGTTCRDPATSEALTLVGSPACTYTKYVAVDRTVCCTDGGDCVTPSATPALPTTPPINCCPKDCGCSSVVSDTATVQIAGTTSCTACFAAADASGSFQVVGSIDGTYTLTRLAPICTWEVNLGGINPDGSPQPPSPVVIHRDCFSNTCVNVGGALDSTATRMNVKLRRTAANTWELTVTVEGGANMFSSTFTWNDQDACTGVGSGGQANTSPGCTLATGCNPSWAASGGTGTAQFP